eukprot:CCRYP_021095-RA/>CCRYP_021095-RA protein AED:0.46 eAED:0.46 QI:0/-1/0/1/-1/1/1/0/79
MTYGDYQMDGIVVGKYYYMDEIDDCLDTYFENEDAIDYLDVYYYRSYYYGRFVYSTDTTDDSEDKDYLHHAKRKGHLRG